LLCLPQVFFLNAECCLNVTTPNTLLQICMMMLPSPLHPLFSSCPLVFHLLPLPFCYQQFTPHMIIIQPLWPCIVSATHCTPLPFVPAPSSHAAVSPPFTTFTRPLLPPPLQCPKFVQPLCTFTVPPSSLQHTLMLHLRVSLLPPLLSFPTCHQCDIASLSHFTIALLIASTSKAAAG